MSLSQKTKTKKNRNNTVTHSIKTLTSLHQKKKKKNKKKIFKKIIKVLLYLTEGFAIKFVPVNI